MPGRLLPRNPKTKQKNVKERKKERRKEKKISKLYNSLVFSPPFPHAPRTACYYVAGIERDGKDDVGYHLYRFPPVVRPLFG